MGAATTYAQGGNPWIGAGAALMSYGLNQILHDGGGDGDGGKGGKEKASEAQVKVSDLTLGDFHPEGPGLAASGIRLNFLKPYGALGSQKGSSLASVAFEKLIPLKSSTRLWTPHLTKEGAMVFRQTLSIGRFVGRWTPYIGWGITAYDVTKNVFVPMSTGASLYRESNVRSGSWISNLPH